MTKLNQIIAIEKSRKAKAAKERDLAYHVEQKEALFLGMTRNYTPATEDEAQLPAESTLVQVTVPQLLDALIEPMASWYDVTAEKDWTNCSAEARADVIVDGQTIVADAPVSYLLFLEKQLVDLYTLVSKIPVVDPAVQWHWDNNTNCFVTDEITSLKTKKVPRNHVKAEATEHHPAQVEVYHEDEIIGTWTTKKLSGALPAKTRQEMLDRVADLQEAVKFAREKANEAEVITVNVGETLLNYIFSPAQDLG